MPEVLLIYIESVTYSNFLSFSINRSELTKLTLDQILDSNGTFNFFGLTFFGPLIIFLSSDFLFIRSSGFGLSYQLENKLLSLTALTITAWGMSYNYFLKWQPCHFPVMVFCLFWPPKIFPVSFLIYASFLIP